jgi:hypothetical protein
MDCAIARNWDEKARGGGSNFLKSELTGWQTIIGSDALGLGCCSRGRWVYRSLKRGTVSISRAVSV